MNGSGRKESLHIACTILQIKVFSPVPVKNYKIEDFYNDLRMVASMHQFNSIVRMPLIDKINLGHANIRIR